MKEIVNVLGVPYKIEIHKHDDDKVLFEKHLDGYCSDLEKKIVISDMSGEDFKYMNEIEKANLQKLTLRHELLHSVFGESGLSSSSNVFNGSWVNNEEMIDFFAIQFPKILEIYREAECL